MRAENPYRAAALAKKSLKESWDLMDSSPDEAIEHANVAMSYIDELILRHPNSDLRRQAHHILTQTAWVTRRAQDRAAEIARER